ncbi:hypothetical protein L2E82_03314 [Cichorium intybus]|uniref:Uncharacterized protein n=2 Tax=Cichorium intybus TaxID=13427 RepID=A0ACB9H501_CICIN|nr:hypothetical protein L2E82_03313 [Cichorium intybus]KAI3790347.1 hypothetical protein L2E82_03314 [Cichorium intybus]
MQPQSMKLYLIFTVFFLSNLRNYEVEGIRLGKITLPVSSNQDNIKISWIKESNDQDHEFLAKIDEVRSGINRKLTTKITSFSSTTAISKNQEPDGNKHDSKQEIESVHGSVGKEDNFLFSLSPEKSEDGKEVASEPYADGTDMMDYAPARESTPIHN